MSVHSVGGGNMKFTFCKKQYFYLGLAVISLTLAVTSYVSAQESSEQVETKETEIETPVKRSQGVLPDRFQNRIINLARNMISRMNAAVVRSEQINRRTESRIQKLKEQGVDTETAEMVLEYAKAELVEAKTTLSTLDAMTVAAVSSESPKESYKQVRWQFRIANASIRDSFTHLKTIIELLKNVEIPDETNGIGDERSADVAPEEE
jgi:ABC-type anion transport system duplicated permease subunit